MHKISLGMLSSVLVALLCGACSGSEGETSGRRDAREDPLVDASTSSCDGSPGVHHEESFEHEGGRRVFELIVPSTWRCGAKLPLLVDFHGAYGAPMPEEAYTNEELVAVAEKLGVVVARPRSLTIMRDGREWSYWDAPAGAIEKNQRFVLRLVEHLLAHYGLDAARTYASGYSNGGNFAIGFLALPASPFAALGNVAAGYWSPAPLPKTKPAKVERIYTATGYRDLHYGYLAPLLVKLRAAGYDADALFERETDDGHSLLAWHYEEMLPFFMSGKRPTVPAAAATWVEEPSPAQETLLEIVRADDGALLVTDRRGRIHRRPPSSGVDLPAAWSTIFASSPEMVLPALATTGTAVIAAGSGLVFEGTIPGGAFTSTELPIDPAIGLAYANSAAASAKGFGLVGSALFGKTLPGGAWTTESLGGVDAQVIGRSLTTETTVIAGRASLIGRSISGQFATLVPAPSGLGNRFLHGVAGRDGRFWIVGQGGATLRSNDDGSSFAFMQSPVRGDLYAVAFRTSEIGIAVGAHGAAIATKDGGITWRDVSYGKDVMLAGVAFDESGRAIAVGERGLVASLAL